MGLQLPTNFLLQLDAVFQSSPGQSVILPDDFFANYILTENQFSSP